MYLCKDCGKYKEKKDFPWLKLRVCRDCQLYRAMNWGKIPWPKPKATKAKQGSLLKARLRRKISIDLNGSDEV